MNATEMVGLWYIAGPYIDMCLCYRRYASTRLYFNCLWESVRYAVNCQGTWCDHKIQSISHSLRSPLVSGRSQNDRFTMSPYKSRQKTIFTLFRSTAIHLSATKSHTYRVISNGTEKSIEFATWKMKWKGSEKYKFCLFLLFYDFMTQLAYRFDAPNSYWWFLSLHSTFEICIFHDFDKAIFACSAVIDESHQLFTCSIVSTADASLLSQCDKLEIVWSSVLLA